MDGYELGRYGPSKSQNLNGFLDELRIYNKALSAEQIKKLYEQDRKKME